MRYPHANSQAVLFSDQVQQLTSLFEQCNDCERTVVLCSLFKRLPLANLKFLQFAIDAGLSMSQTTNNQFAQLEDNANSAIHLIKLVQRYQSLLDFSGDEITLGDSSETLGKYTRKADVVQDMLTYLLLLKPGNDEAKKAYIQMLPMLVEDGIKHVIPVELVQQMLSYLLIHPIITNEDRKSLSQWLRQLEEHMSLSYKSSSNALLPTENSVCSFISTASSASSTSSQSSTSSSSSTWQTIQPTSLLKPQIQQIHVTQEFCDEIPMPKYPQPIGQGSCGSLNSSTSPSVLFNNDEHHVSFSKNGTEILESDLDITPPPQPFKKMRSQSIPAGERDYLTVPCLFKFDDQLFDVMGGYDNSIDDCNVKTRRSNSLTTPPANENLASLQQKPRSFSLSMERGQITSSGSDSRLDELSKMNNMRHHNGAYHVGMTHIGQWLKSLRLHKYFWLFSNMSYEQMLDITEEYLENLGVTKGARHKLVLCIQKLGERCQTLQQIEKELLDGTRTLKTALDELTHMVMTPMKALNTVPKDEDVAMHFIRVLDCAFQTLVGLKYLSQQDEEAVNVFFWVVEKALHNEAFIQQLNHLKEFRFKLSKIKMSFGPKLHYKPGQMAANKIRWTGNLKQPPHVGHKPSIQQPCSNAPLALLNCDIAPKMTSQRKSSMPYYAPPPHFNQNYQQQGYKSSSYPNFPSQTRSDSREKLNHLAMLQQQQHHTHFSLQNHLHQFQQQMAPKTAAYHRHSLNNLITTQLQMLQAACNPPPPTMGGSLKSLKSNNPPANFGCGSMYASKSTGSVKPTPVAPNSIGDINSRLESLCLQMTEQAIN